MTKLNQRRLAGKMKLREIAKALKITPQTVQQQERRGIKKKETAIRYAAALGCQWFDLMD